MKIAGRKNVLLFLYVTKMFLIFCPTISIIRIKWSKVVKSASKMLERRR